MRNEEETVVKEFKKKMKWERGADIPTHADEAGQRGPEVDVGHHLAPALAAVVLEEQDAAHKVDRQRAEEAGRVGAGSEREKGREGKRRKNKKVK